jgi:hypothetical protein
MHFNPKTIFLASGWRIGLQVRIEWEHRFGGLDVPEEQIFDVPVDLEQQGRLHALGSESHFIYRFALD